MGISVICQKTLSYEQENRKNKIMGSKVMAEIDREELLSLFSANFNDGEPIETRVGSKDTWSADAIVDFIDMVKTYVADKENAAINAAVLNVLDIWSQSDSDKTFYGLVAKDYPQALKITSEQLQNEREGKRES